MKVRSRLALATAIALLALLVTFYIGGRVILLNAFRMAEKAVLRSVPDLVKSIHGELDQLEGVANAALALKPVFETFRQHQPALAEREFPVVWLLHEDVQLVALADATGHVFSAVYLPPGGEAVRTPSASLQRHLQPDAPLLSFTNRLHAMRSGMIVLDEGPMLVAAQRVPADLAQPATGVLLVGRDLHDDSVLRRLGTALPGVRIDRPKNRRLELRPVDLTRTRGQSAVERAQSEIVSERIEMSPWHGVGLDGYEALLPIFDVYGRNTMSLVIRLPRTFSAMAEVAMGWLSVFVALIGILFIAPLLILQGHAVLNPLTRLASEIQALQFREPGGRRLNWSGSDEFGVVAGAVDSMLDAIDHERRKIEEIDNRRRALLEANPDLLFLFDRNGCILDVKCPEGTEGTLTMAPGEVVGRNLRDVRPFPPEVLDRLSERSRAVFETGQLQSLDFHLVRPDGQDYWAECRFVRIDENRALVIERNMTDRNKAERGRRLLEVRIGQKQKMESLGLLASGIAHDFNNILAAILGHAEEAATKLPVDSPTADALTHIRSAAIRASGLTRQLQAYAGQGTVEFNSVNLNNLLSDMAQLLRSSLSKKATLEINLDPQLPVIDGDPSQLWQVAMNLLLNASEALDGKSGTISLSTRRVTAGVGELAEFLSVKPLAPGIYVLLEIRDTGHGMPPEVLGRIFDPFFSTKAKGRGLGLSAVVGIVQAHGGGIAMRSTYSVGTTFRIVLPQMTAQPESKPVVAMPAVIPAATPAAMQTQHLLLLAEDDPDIRKVTLIALRTAGYEVVAAENGRVAVDLFVQRAKEVQVVLLDQEMPVMNGEEAFRAIRAIREDVPIVVMTGYGAVAAQEHFGHLHPSGILGKPFTRTQLTEVLSRACQPSSGGAKG